MPIRTPSFKASELFAKKDVPIIIQAAAAIYQDLSKRPDGRIGLNLSAINEFRKEVICSRIRIRGFEEKKGILRDLIIKALKKLKGQEIKEIKIGRFSQCLAEQLDAYVSQDTNPFSIIFALHLAGEIQESHFKALFFGKAFKVLSWVDVERIKGWKDFIEAATYFKCGARSYEMYPPILKEYFIPLVYTTSAHSPEDAFHDANIEFEILRAILNLKYSFGVLTLLQIGPPEPMAKFYPPPFYPIFDHAGSYIEMFYNLEPYIYKKNNISVEIIKDLASLCERIAVMNPVLQDIFRDSLLKYVSALDTFDWRNAFLYFWQVLENLSLNSVEENLRMSEIAARIKNLMGQAKTVDKLVIDGLVTTRNRLVHLGKFSKYGLAEVNYIKIVAEKALSNFIVFAEAFRNKRGLLNYYADATITDSSLRERIKNIKYLLETRKKVRDNQSKKKKELSHQKVT